MRGPARARYPHLVKIALLAVLLLSFATLMTTHVAIAARLLWRARPRSQALVALVVPPLAPFFAHRQRWRGMAALWVGSVLTYAVALTVASAT